MKIEIGELEAQMIFNEKCENEAGGKIKAKLMDAVARFDEHQNDIDIRRTQKRLEDEIYILEELRNCELNY